MSGSIFGVIWEISVGYVFLILDVASLLVFPRGDWHRFMTSFVIGNGRISSNRKTYKRGGHSSFCVNVSYGVQRQGVDCFLRREFSVNYNNTTRKKETVERIDIAVFPHYPKSGRLAEDSVSCYPDVFLCWRHLLLVCAVILSFKLYLLMVNLDKGYTQEGFTWHMFTAV